ncbi:MAG: DUF4407 domain-containing protein [Cyclobacteriaceae bacterium]
MNKMESFFIYCAGASFSLIKRAPSEKSKYVGIGATIFFTGLMAAISSGYALFSIFQTIYPPIVFGLFWGLMIFNLDRYIVLSMRKGDVWYKEYLQVMPRVVLAILIALVISKPLELKIFEKEIVTELELLKEEITQSQHQAVTSRFSNRQDSLKNQISILKSEILAKQEKRDELMEVARREADGTGGSGKVNPGPIYKIKKEEALRVQQELEVLELESKQAMALLTDEIQSLEQEKSTDITKLGKPDVRGLSFQLTALSRLGNKYSSIAIANWFIVLLFIAIELAPILTKLISNKGPYDELLEVHEHHFKNYRKEKVQVSDIRLERTLAKI